MYNYFIKIFCNDCHTVHQMNILTEYKITEDDLNDDWICIVCKSMNEYHIDNWELLNHEKI